MPTDDKQQCSASGLPDLPMYEGNSAAPTDDEEIRIPPASEIATRLNLLGKLIIPRTPR